MPRRYGPLGTNIWGSEKFNALANDTHRLGFIYLLSSDHTTPNGVYRLPPSYAAEDRGISVETAEAMISDLAHNDMIELGPDHWLRVKRWFFEETGASNPMNVVGFCSAFASRKLERAGPLRPRAFAELLCATSLRAMAWDQGTASYGKMTEALIQCAVTLSRMHNGDLVRAIADFGPVADGSLLHVVLDTVSSRTRSPVFETVNEMAREPVDTVSIPYRDPIETQKLKQTQKQTLTQKQNRTLTETPRPAVRDDTPEGIDASIAWLNAKRNA